jgi:hypothetical protein
VAVSAIPSKTTKSVKEGVVGDAEIDKGFDESVEGAESERVGGEEDGPVRSCL